MSEVTRYIRTIAASGTFAVSDSDSWVNRSCPHCANPTMVAIAVYDLSPGIVWMRCPSCGAGSVYQQGELSPSSKPLRVPAGLPAVDAAIWAEVRTCLGVGANAAAVMLCRKLLFHIAVGNGLPEKDDRDRAPSFYSAIEHLQQQEIITRKMRPWVDRIKDVGNDANHEVTPISPEQAADVAGFTLQLLILAYEMDAIMNDPGAAESVTASAVDH